ncbi:MAG: methyltransferase family protein [Candidatus Thorarchaeota archaeon]
MSPHQEHRLGIEAPHSHLIQGLSIVVFLVVWILDSLVFSFSTILNNFIPLFIRIILFFILISIAYYLIHISHKILFRQPENKDDLITEGIFRHVRHPMYLGVLLIYLACILLSFSFITLVVWIVIFLTYDRLASFEEKELEKIFKEKYLEYKKKVSKWFPR